MTGVGLLFARERNKVSETEINVDQAFVSHCLLTNSWKVIKGKFLDDACIGVKTLNYTKIIWCDRYEAKIPPRIIDCTITYLVAWNSIFSRPSLWRRENIPINLCNESRFALFVIYIFN